jgi:catechol 2,3-dioxygenase
MNQTTNRAGADVPYVSIPAGRIGVRPAGFRLPDGAHVGTVAIQVASLQRSLDFYEGVIGYRTLGRRDGATGPIALLGNQSGDRVLLELHEKRGVRAVPRRALLGLYHSAVLLPSRADLGRFVTHAVAQGVHVGSSDHLVSEATYLVDPDGLTVEVYRDRARSEWIVNEHGEIVTGILPLDVADVQGEGGTTRWEGLPGGSTIGHVHFYVGDLAAASAFYHDGLGFDRVIWTLPGALFVSASGYHHHVGLNVWAAGSPVATEDDARLLRWDLVLPDRAAVDAASASLEKEGVSVLLTPEGTFATDPWGITVRLLAESSDSSELHTASS